MKYLSNLHTHTIYCDGKSTIEENIISAIDKKLISLGFSGHSYFYKDSYSMSEENTIKYLEDLKKYKKIYKDKIQVYIGIEGDYYSNLNKKTDDEMGLDYRIGSVHYISDDNNNYFPIDMSKDGFNDAVKHFGNIKEAIPAFFAIFLMPLSYSIINGIGFSFIALTIISLITYNKEKKFKENIHPLLIILSISFIIYYILLLIQ